MTKQQEAINLINQLSEENLDLIIGAMNDLLNGRKPHIVKPYVSPMSPEEIKKAFNELREKLSKYPIEDEETARDAELSKKYAQFM